MRERILIVAHYSQQPPYNTMLRYHNWAKELIRRGYDVTIVAANMIHNTSIDMISVIGSEKTICEGIHYQYVRIPSYCGNGFRRKLGLILFCRNAFKDIKGVYDIIVLSGPFLFPFAKNAYRHTPIIVDVCDLWPLSIVEYAGYSNKHPLIKLLYRIEKRGYIKADALIFSMEGGKDYVKEQSYASRIDFSKIFHINMGCDIKTKDRELEENSFILDWDPTAFNVIYCGSIRAANQVKQISDAARIIQDKGLNNICFQVYGNGDDLDSIKNYSIEQHIDNIHFYGRIEKEKIPFILSCGKVALLTYRNVSLWKYGGSQSKLFDYLASGRPVICNVKFGYNLIERYQCGVVTENQSAQALADAVEKLYRSSEEELNSMGKRARKVAEMYDQPILVDKLEEVFEYVKEGIKK